MKITVIGSGRWGSFIAWYIERLGHEVVLYGRKSSERFKQLCATRRNEYIELSHNVLLSDDLEASLASAQIIVISIGAQTLRDFAREMNRYPLNGKRVVLCMKGLESGTGKRLSQVVDEEIQQTVKTAVWLGPGHVQDFVNGVPNCMVIDSTDSEFIQELIPMLSSDIIRFYYGRDLIGNEIGAAAKNVIGIAAGMLDGVGHQSLKGALMARGTKEVGRLIQAMGGNEISAYGLCHLGDYQATLFSEYSHNRLFGEQYIKKLPFSKLAEGVETARALKRLTRDYRVEMPINDAVHALLFEGADRVEVIEELFTRSLKHEF